MSPSFMAAFQIIDLGPSSLSSSGFSKWEHREDRREEGAGHGSFRVAAQIPTSPKK